MTKNLCIIPARGGSKRIPKKNIKLFLGKPIIAYSIVAALESGLFSEVMVSTDSEEIAEIAKQYGAKVPFIRSSMASDDYATTFDVIKEVIFEYSNDGKSFDHACCLYPTAPFITSKILNKAFTVLKDQDLDSVLPVMPFSFPIQRAFKIENQGELSYVDPSMEKVRSQDIDKRYHDAGQFYFFKVQKCLESESLVMKKSGAIIIDELKGQDIDSLVDWKIAELKYELL